jgi:hypothetical protein
MSARSSIVGKIERVLMGADAFARAARSRAGRAARSSGESHKSMGIGRSYALF